MFYEKCHIYFYFGIISDTKFGDQYGKLINHDYEYIARVLESFNTVIDYWGKKLQLFPTKEDFRKFQIMMNLLEHRTNPKNKQNANTKERYNICIFTFE